MRNESLLEKEKLQEIITLCETYRQVLIKLNRSESASSYKWLKRRINLYGIDISHFMSPKDVMQRNFKKGLIKKIESEEIFIKDSNISRATVKRYILENNLIKYECFFCHNNGHWNNKKISLILDHKNGISNDNTITNLRFLCPNCNATLETHCLGADGVIKRKIKKIEKQNRKKQLIIKRKKDKPNLRKVIRPSKEELFKLLKTHTYVSLGAEYGVSDVSIHNWGERYLKQQNQEKSNNKTDSVRRKTALNASSFVKKHNHQKIIEMHNDGFSYNKIMKELNIKSKGTISFIIQKSMCATGITE